MKRLFLHLYLFLVAPLLLAAGTSGNYLYSPGNEATTTKQFGSSTDPFDRGGWLFEGSKGYARPGGVSLPKEEKGVLCYNFPENETPQRIDIVTVKCSVAASGNVNQECTLTVELVGSDCSQTSSFVVPALNSQVILTFRFGASADTTGLRLSNSGTTLFELAEVTWSDQLPEMKVDLAATSTCVVGGTITYSINDVTGGCGTYAYADVTFNGETHSFSGDFPWSGTFTAPALSGEYALTVFVEDDEGNEVRVTREITIVPYATPVALTATSITRESFDLSWELAGGATPSKYTVKVTLDPEHLLKDVVETPTWKEVSPGLWETETAVDLDPQSGKFGIESATLTIEDAVTKLKMRTAAEDTWQTKTGFGGIYMLGALAQGQERVYFQVEAAEPPRTLTFRLAVEQVLLSQTLQADAQRRTISLSGLPTGKKVLCTVTATYQTASGETMSKTSEPYAVQMAALPGFASAKYYDAWGILQLSWPQGETNLSGKISIYALKSVEHQVPKGLYLTRVLYTQKDKTGTTSKAIAITNTSNRAISLNGTYTLKVVNAKGTKRTWDFSEKDESNKKIYPYVIAPGADLIVAYEGHLPVDVREGICTTNSSAMNVTHEWTMSLCNGETVQNSLTPQANALVRLEADSLESLVVTAIDKDTTTLDGLYEAWTEIEAVKLLGTHTFYQGTVASQMSIGAYLMATENTRRIWVECVTMQGENTSEPLTVVLWEAPVASGFQLRIR